MLNRRQLLAAASVLTLAHASSAEARFPRGGGSGIVSGWSQLKTGAGGFVRGIDIAASDNTLVTRNDGGLGAQFFDAAATNPGNAGGLGVWRPLVTTATMPANTVGFNASTNFLGVSGVTDLRIAPSNTQILYMVYRGSVYKTLNQGASWSFLIDLSAQYNAHPNEDWNNAYAQCSYRMAVHPTDPLTVLIGTPLGGLYKTTDGGSNWTTVATVPVSTVDAGGSVKPGICGICFDPATPTTIYAVSFGNGTYRTTTGVGGTWSLLTGGPTNAEGAVVNNGIYYVAGGSSSGISGAGQNTTLIKFASGSFTTLVTNGGISGLHAVAVNPSDNLNIVYAGGDGSLHQSSDAGATWTHNYTVGTLTATDCPWLPSTGTFLSCGGIVFDQAIAHKIWMAAGVGVWTITALTSSTLPANGTAIGYSSVSAGIENLTANQIISPPNGGLVDAAWDFQNRYHGSLTSYPTSYGISKLGQIVGGWSVDAAKDGSSVVVALNNSNIGNGDASGISSNNGSTWSLFATAPKGSGDSTYQLYGGQIAAATATNFVVQVGSAPDPWSSSTTYGSGSTVAGTNGHIYKSSVGSNLNNNPVTDGGVHWTDSTFQIFPQFTTNGGSTWTYATGLPVDGWNWATFTAWQTLCADSAGNYYLFNSNHGLYKSTTQGASWTQVDSNAIDTERFQSGKRLVAPPGTSQLLIYTAGGVSSGAHPSAQSLFYRTSDAGVWSAAANVKDVWAVGYGAIATGATAPTTWLVGWINPGTGLKFGIWVSKNFASSPGSATWTWLTDFPFNNADQIKWIAGDSNDQTKCYLAFNDTGYGVGQNLSY